MQRRLLFSTVAVAITAVVLFGLPLGFILVRLQISTAHQQVQRDAITVARTLQNRLNSGLYPDISDAANAARALPDRYVSISREGGPPRTFGDVVPVEDAISARASTKDFQVIVEANRARKKRPERDCSGDSVVRRMSCEICSRSRKHAHWVSSCAEP